MESLRKLKEVFGCDSLPIEGLHDCRLLRLQPIEAYIVGSLCDSQQQVVEPLLFQIFKHANRSYHGRRSASYLV